MDFMSFFFRQLFDKPSPIPADINLEGQTALVTGSNVGLGFEAVRKLVQHKISRVILAIRSVRNGEAAKTKLQEEYPKCVIEVWELDQNSFESITAFQRRAEGLDRLDIVILNAGVMKSKFIRSASGHELHLQVNYLSTALLSLLLLAPLKATAKLVGRSSHLTAVISEMHMWTSFKQRSAPNIFEKLDDDNSFSSDVYNVSKLLGILWIRELASKTTSSEVIINTVNPGLCWSKLHRDQENFGFTVFKRICARTTAQGGHCLIDAVTVKQAESHRGYLSEQKLKP